MIGIRADGNDKIGIGHIMRCLTIAEELKKREEEIVFFLADSSCRNIIEERGYRCRVLGTVYECMEEELPILLELLEEISINTLLIDSYFVTTYYLDKVREKVVCIYLDDMNSFKYPVDLIINYNIYAKAKDYPYALEWIADSVERNNKTKVLTGIKYAPVRKEFLENRKLISAEVKDIMITLGGSDIYNLSTKIAIRLLRTTDCNIHVVCGPFNIYREELKKLAQTEERVIMHENVKEMWLLMKQCDLAVSAAGSTMCELAVAGIPTVTFSYVENQRRIAEGFSVQVAALSAGHYEKKNEVVFLEDIEKLVGSMIDCFELREEVITNAAVAVDGYGAGRIAGAILLFNAN